MRVQYSEFVQRVRRYRPSDLLPALATTAIDFFEMETWKADRVRLAWALAVAAKASIVAGNEYRNRQVTPESVYRICATYNELDSPIARETDDVSASLGAFLVRIAYEQFPYQQSYFEEISRLGAMFDGVDSLATEILDTRLIQMILGCSLGDFVGAGFVISVGARSSAGYFDPEWPSLWDSTKGIHGKFSMDVVRQVFHDHFVSSFSEVRSAADLAKQTDPALRHHEFNPLAGRPFVTMPDGRHLAPQPHFAFQKLSPPALYYAGVDVLDQVSVQAFTRDVGFVFQEYVGRQLRLMPGGNVVPDIVYNGSQRSVDWFVIFDEVVVLVEAKSTRLSVHGRMGGNRLKDDVERSVGKAFSQVANTESLLSEGHPDFAAIPIDRPRVAIIATMEPYWAANTPFIAAYLPSPAIPTSVASIRSIERLVDVMIGQGGPESLVDILNDTERSTWNLENALPTIETHKNPILAEAWDRYPVLGDPTVDQVV